MGDFVFYAVSQAYYCDMRKSFPKTGVENFGELFHRNNIPVTWLTNPEGALRGKELFTKFHENYGDEVILWCRPTSGSTSSMKDAALKMGEGEIRQFIQKNQRELKEILPFAEVDHIGYIYRTMPAIRAMRSLRVKSCYGHCWEMIDPDGVTDKGCPWGFYYIDANKSWKRPSQKLYDVKKNKYGIIANEWLQHDLNKSWNYYGSCSVFSFDPNDVERAKICNRNNIDYWKEAFREYYRNREWNDFLPFVFHQESHEQESTLGGWNVYPLETVQETYKMTEKFLEFVKSPEFEEIRITTLVDAIERYRSRFDLTNPTYCLFRDINIKTKEWLNRKNQVWKLYLATKNEEEVEDEILDPKDDYGKIKYLSVPYGWQRMLYKDKEPFPESFVYTDNKLQLFFHEGRESPVKMYNYTQEIDEVDFEQLFYNKDLFLEKETPSIEVKPTNYDVENDKAIEVEISSQKAIPFGFCLWGDFDTNRWDVEFELSSLNTLDIKEINNINSKLLFFRIDLRGKGMFGLKLAKKVELL